MVSNKSSTYSKRLMPLVSWSHWFTFFNILAAILLSTFYLFAESMPETLLGKLYLFTTWLSHMGFLTFIGFVLLIFPLTLIYPKTRFIRATASIVFTFGLLLLLLDAFIYARLGYHLNASSSDQIISLIQTQISQNSRAFWFISLLLFFAILTFELVVSNYAWKHLRQLQKNTYAKFVVFGLVVSFFFSHITHIWADANLEYDVLRQDTVLPLSYPATAKTLLTKYGMFDKNDYMARRTSSLSFGKQTPKYPIITQACETEFHPNNSAILVLTSSDISQRQIAQFSRRASENTLPLVKHIDNALPKNSWFNLLYSLPTIYKKPVIAEQKPPVLFQVLATKNIATNLTVFSNKEDESLLEYQGLFDHVNYFKNISNFVVGKKLSSNKQALHIYYFAENDQYQFELFVDALLLAQRNKQEKDTIWISGIGNNRIENGLNIKPALFINPKSDVKAPSRLTSHFDLVPTLLSTWLNCPLTKVNHSVGKDITTLSQSRIIANTVDNGIMVFSKDKSVLVDQNGNFQSYSRQLESPIMVNRDFPLMIDGVHFIKQYSQKADTKDSKSD
ncbi:DUF3413 domain-containing protein [Thalassotalea sp. 1_MG-2023]|uniref:DUF3413 domain-containing protein n=1 Tax=Thalassotalea sp. 1_MG-2023 TaxID=3062680 RepID=UPI0026E1F449|nr:DUF3413 domain-containing protein [Thalassotalea sp. 1_MG-2023]MDO6426843.1 DUF3413 domain-containing protein [Thalassotalea sp. 1_MG-2023]